MVVGGSLESIGGGYSGDRGWPILDGNGSDRGIEWYCRDQITACAGIYSEITLSDAAGKEQGPEYLVSQSGSQFTSDRYSRRWFGRSFGSFGPAVRFNPGG